MFVRDAHTLMSTLSLSVHQQSDHGHIPTYECTCIITEWYSEVNCFHPVWSRSPTPFVVLFGIFCQCANIGM